MLDFSEVQLHTLRTGHIPDTIPSLRSLHQSLSSHIADLQDQLALKQAELRYCSALLSPVRRIPREVLFHIFSFANDAECQSSRITIGGVCRQWRSLSRSFPSLWSNIRIQASFRWQDYNQIAHFAPRFIPKVKLKFIELCLVLSHPRPLDIVVDFSVIAHSNTEHMQYVDQVLQLLSSHASRWRSFKCVAEKSFLRECTFEIGTKLRSLHLKTLEELVIQFKGELLGGTLTPIHVPNLRVLNTSLQVSTTKFVSRWAGLTTFTGPFDHPASLLAFLHVANGLTSLYVTHLGSSDMSAPPVFQPLIHNNLRILKLNQCGISPILNTMTFPFLEEFAMPTFDDWQLAHPNCYSMGDEILEALIQRSSCPIRTLDIGNGTLSPMKVMEIFQDCGATLVRLRVYFAATCRDTIYVLDALTIRDTAQTLFPNLAELEIETNTRKEILFVGNRLEDMLRSRCDVPGEGVLKRLRLERDDRLEGVMPDYATSALSLYLQQLQNGGLDVEWWMCQNDMLEECRRISRPFL